MEHAFVLVAREDPRAEKCAVGVDNTADAVRIAPCAHGVHMQLELLRECREEGGEIGAQLRKVPAPVFVAPRSEMRKVVFVQDLRGMRYCLAVSSQLERDDVLQRVPIGVGRVVRPLTNSRVDGDMDDRLVQIHHQRELALLKQPRGRLGVDALRFRAGHLDRRGGMQRRKRRLRRSVPA